jgi:hypothetical protein
MGVESPQKWREPSFREKDVNNEGQPWKKSLKEEGEVRLELQCCPGYPGASDRAGAVGTFLLGVERYMVHCEKEQLPWKPA